MPDFSTYQPPGIYIEEEQTALVSVVGITPSVVAIVGPSVGYRTKTETITLEGTTAVTFAEKGINPASVTVRGADGTLYVDGTDYVLTVLAGADGSVLTTQDNGLTIERGGASTIPSGSVVYVAYQFTDETYHSPLRVRDFDEVKDAYGEPLDLPTGAIASPLSLAAKVALENGATEVMLVATTGTATAVTRSQVQAALNKITSQHDVNIVVVLPVGITGSEGTPGDVITIAEDLRTHVTQAATNGVLRVGFIGFGTDVTVDPVTIATTVASNRVVLAWPNRLHYFNGYDNTTIEVGGYYLAAGMGGRAAGLPVQEPLTKKPIRGFAGIPASLQQTMGIAQKNTWSDQGVAVGEIDRRGRIVVRHGTSTDRTNLHTREVSLTRIKDALVNMVRDTTEDAQLVGSYIDEDTPLRIKGVISGVLETAKNLEIINDYLDLKVRQRSVDPSVIEVKFQYRPAYPLNYIVVAFSIDTRTGETDIIDTAA